MVALPAAVHTMYPAGGFAVVMGKPSSLASES